MTIWCPYEMTYLDTPSISRLLALDAERLHTVFAELSHRPSHERVVKAATEIRTAKRHLAAMTFRLSVEGEGHGS